MDMDAPDSDWGDILGGSEEAVAGLALAHEEAVADPAQTDEEAEAGVDWDDIGFEAGPGPDPGERNAGVADALACVAPAPEGPKAPRKSRWSVFIPGPKNRSPAEAALAAARMRDHKALRRDAHAEGKVKEHVKEALQKLRDAGLLNDANKTTVSVRRSMLSIVIATSRPLHVPYEAMATVAFSSIQRRADVARAFQFDAKAVTRLRCLVAHCGMSSDAKSMKLLGDSFCAKAPSSFVSSLAADATKEQLNLQFLGMEANSELGKSSWSVQVSGQRFAWSIESLSAEDLEWYVLELVRPNVALIFKRVCADIVRCMLHSTPKYHLSASSKLSD